MIQKRIGIYIYYKHNKFIRQLKRFGHIIYINKNQRYLLTYTNEEDLDHTVSQLNQLKYVTKVLTSEYKNIARTYEKEDYESKDYRVI